MKVLMLWKHYPQYLSYFYEKHPLAIDLPFETHRNEILDDHFGWPGELSRYMNRQGTQTEFIIANAEHLQKKWAQENDFKSYSAENWEKEVVMEQIKRFRPDVLWITSIFDYFGDFIKKASKYHKKAITWVSCPTPNDLDVSGFAVLITSHPEILKDKHNFFSDVIITYPSFDSDILNKISNVKKKHAITFIGGISTVHIKRVEILAYLIENGIDLKVFGYLYEQPFPSVKCALMQAGGDILKRRDIHKGLDALKSPFLQTAYQRNLEIIKTVHQGPVFGLDMYRTIAESRITLNVHGDVAGNHASNIRMFEATGIGTCLLTENSDNINELFKPGEEVITYKSKEELLEIINRSIWMNEEIEKIAHAGQKRTLQNNTLERLFNSIKPAFDI